VQVPGEMSVQGLALLGDFSGGGQEGLTLTTRMFDADGDGRNDLFLVDFDSDGTVDAVVRGLDADGDGVNDTFIRYDEDGEIQAIGRLDPESREFEVVGQEAEDYEDLLSSLGLADVTAPDEALFTTFDDPYFVESFGSAGEEVPEASEDAGVFADADVTEVDEADLGSLDPGAAVADEDETAGPPDSASAAPDAEAKAGSAEDAAAGGDNAESDVPEVTPRVVDIEDRSGAEDGSDLYARVDKDGDGLADDEERLSRTSDGTWHGDINRDGYSEEVAFDRDQDGRIEAVDTAGRGSSTDTVGAEQVVSPESENIVDRHPGEDDSVVEAEQAAAADVSGDDVSGSDAGSGSAAGAASSDDSGGACDAGSTVSTDTDDSDVGSTATDSGSSDSGGSDPDNS